MAKSRVDKLIEPYVVRHGRRFRLKDIDPADTGDLSPDKKLASELLSEGVARLEALQELLYAQDRWGVLLIFQAMDAAGKDGVIAHVMSGVNPQGCQVYSFKQPSNEELDHDFLWRSMIRLPERGRIGIFNRSYYEDVLVVRVHPEVLQSQKLPPRVVTKHLWKERFEDIVSFERYLAHNGYIVLKFFLHISPKEQARRFRKRLDEPEKNWKFSLGDLRERELWPQYMSAYEDAIRHTAAPHAPWVVVPGNKKWFARLVVAAAIIDALEELHMTFPRLDGARKREIAKGRALLDRLTAGRGSRATGGRTR
jgi:PPK2 family polyphosphate:nucleotide phosphotransferase